jgi:hypothetical protein
MHNSVSGENVFNKKIILFLTITFMVTGCGLLKVSLPDPTVVDSIQLSSTTTVPTLEQVQIVASTPAMQSTEELPGSAFTETVPNVDFPWKTYYSDSYGFSFFYPAVYDEQQY